MEALITNLITWLATVIDIVTGSIIGFAILEATIKTIMLYFVYIRRNIFANFTHRQNINEVKERIRL